VCCGHSQALPPVQLRTDSQLIQCCVVYVQEGGLNGFMHCFLAEVMAICRAHVAALGGNALVAFQLTECIIEDNVHKNQVTTAVRCRRLFLTSSLEVFLSHFTSIVPLLLSVRTASITFVLTLACCVYIESSRCVYRVVSLCVYIESVSVSSWIDTSLLCVHRVVLLYVHRVVPLHVHRVVPLCVHRVSVW